MSPIRYSSKVLLTGTTVKGKCKVRLYGEKLVTITSHNKRLPKRPATWHTTGMAVSIVKIQDVPKRHRNAVPRIMKTADWVLVEQKMIEGLQPDQVIMFSVTAEELARYRIKNIRAAARPIKAYVSGRKLPYTISTKTTPEGGVIVIRPKTT
jgi:hypothetical protein